MACDILPQSYKRIYNKNDSTSIESMYTRDELVNKFVVYNGDEYFIFGSKSSLRDNILEFFTVLAKLPENQRSFSEVIFGFNKQKIKFDIDMPSDKILNINQVLLKETNDIQKLLKTSDENIKLLCQIIKNVFSICYKILLDDIIVCTSHGYYNGNYKFSYHLIVNDYCVLNNNEARKFTSLVMEQVNKDLPQLYPFIDHGVNKSLQNFRMIYNHKPNDTRLKVFQDTNITVKMVEATIIQAVDKCTELEALEDSILTPKSVSELPEDYIMEEAKKMLEPHANGFIFSKIQNNFVLYKRLIPTFCEICKRVHDKCDSFYGIVSYTKNTSNTVYVYYNCFRAQHAKSQQVGIINQDPDRIILSREDKLKKVIETNKTNSITMPSTRFDQLPETNKNIYCSSKLQPFELVPTLAIRAQMKMGKTNNLVEYIDKHFQDGLKQHNIIFISFRQTFSETIKKKFKDFKLYSELKGRITEPRLIIQVESLHRYNIDQSSATPSLVILDECESILEQFDGGLVRNFEKTFAVFQWLLRFTEHLVIMDANLSDRSYNSIQKIRDKPIFYHCNTMKNGTQDNYYITSAKDQLLGQIYKCLDNKEKIVIPVSSLVFGESVNNLLRAKYPDLKIQFYSSKTSETEKKIQFADVNTYWDSLDVLIYTPTVSAGVSFEKHNFDSICAYFTDMSCSVETCLQMLGRVRNLHKKAYYICIESSTNYLPTTVEEIKNNLYNQREFLFRNENKKQNLPIPHEYLENGKIRFYENDYFTIWLENKRMRNLSKNMFLERFITYITHNGSQIHKLEIEGVSKGELSVMTKNTKELFYKSIADAEDLKSEDIVLIENNFDNDKAYDRTAYQKYKLRKFYELMDVKDNKYTESINANFVKVYNKFDVKFWYKNLRSILNNGNIPENIELSLQEMKNNELNWYIKHRERVNFNDLRRKSIYCLNYLAYGIMKLVGYNTFYDPSLIPVDAISTSFENNYKDLYDYSEKLAAFLETKKSSISIFIKQPNLPNDKYVDRVINNINSLLYKVYGCKIKKYKTDQQLYQMISCQHFVLTSQENGEENKEEKNEENKEESGENGEENKEQKNEENGERGEKKENGYKIKPELIKNNKFIFDFETDQSDKTSSDKIVEDPELLNYIKMLNI